MRWLFAVVATTALAIGTISGGGLGWLLPETLSSDVRAALEVRCGKSSEAANRECQRSLSRRFAAGAIDPVRVLRMHCTRWQGPWGGPSEKPPEVCSERYGGWIRG